MEDAALYPSTEVKGEWCPCQTHCDPGLGLGLGSQVPSKTLLRRCGRKVKGSWGRAVRMQGSTPTHDTNCFPWMNCFPTLSIHLRATRCFQQTPFYRSYLEFSAKLPDQENSIKTGLPKCTWGLRALNIWAQIFLGWHLYSQAAARGIWVTGS